MPAREEAFPAVRKSIFTDLPHPADTSLRPISPFRMQSMRKTGILKGQCPLSGFPKGSALWPVPLFTFPHMAWVLTCRPPSRVMR